MLTESQLNWLNQRNPGFARAYADTMRLKKEAEANRAFFNRKDETVRHGHPDYPRRAALQIANRGESA